jgi:hypothetical protein
LQLLLELGVFVNISLNYFFNRAPYFFRESIKASLTNQQKKILAISSLVLGFFTACYVAWHCYKLTKEISKDKFKNHDNLAHEIFHKQVSRTIILEDSPQVTIQNIDVSKKNVEKASHALFLEDLPQEMILQILTFLDGKSWGAVSKTNKFFHFFSQDPILMDPLLEAFEIKLSLLPPNKRLELAKKKGILLTQLNLTGASVTDQQFIELFEACPNIESLNLSKCSHLTTAAINKLPKKLKSLKLTQCSSLKVDAIDKFSHGLKSLELSFLVFTGDVFDKLPVDLESLNLSWCWNLTEASIDKLPKNLKSLKLSRSLNFTDAAIDKLPKDLQSLDLSFWNLTNDVIERLPKNLKSLDLTGCMSLTDDVIDKLPQNLRSLNLSWCFNLTDKALDKLPKDLEFLNLTHCKKVTDAAIKRLSDARNISIQR